MRIVECLSGFECRKFPEMKLMSSDRPDGYLYSKLRLSRGVHPYPVREVWQLHR